MLRFTEVQAKVRSLTDLLQIVGALRSLAAARLQEARNILVSVQAYRTAVEGTLQRTRALAGNVHMPSNQPTGTETLIVAFLAEHGFVGGFNNRLLDVLEPAYARGPTQLVIVGTRGYAAAIERGFQVAQIFTAPSHIDGALPTARLITEDLYRRLAKGNIAECLLCNGTLAPESGWEPKLTSLLPLPPPRPEDTPLSPPLVHLAQQDLVSELVEEWFFAVIMWAQMESLACENGARLLAMEAAHTNVSKKADQYRHLARTRRQEAITTELLDIVLGTQAAL